MAHWRAQGIYMVTSRLSQAADAESGRAVARALAEAGADIAVNYNACENEAKQVCSWVEGVGSRCVTVRANVSVATEVARMVETVQGVLDGAVAHLG